MSIIFSNTTSDTARSAGKPYFCASTQPFAMSPILDGSTAFRVDADRINRRHAPKGIGDRLSMAKRSAVASVSGTAANRLIASQKRSEWRNTSITRPASTLAQITTRMMRLTATLNNLRISLRSLGAEPAARSPTARQRPVHELDV